MNRATLAAAAAVGAVLFALGCDSANTPNTRVSLTNADDGRSIAVLVGDEIDITLQTIGPGEYGTPVVSSRSIRLLGEFPAGLPNPGGVRQLFHFEAVTVGRAEVTIQPVDGFPVPRYPFAITVEVR